MNTHTDNFKRLYQITKEMQEVRRMYKVILDEALRPLEKEAQYIRETNYLTFGCRS